MAKVRRKNWYVTITKNEYGGKVFFDHRLQQIVRSNKYE